MKGDGSMTRDELITALESASEGDQCQPEP